MTDSKLTPRPKGLTLAPDNEFDRARWMKCFKTTIQERRVLEARLEVIVGPALFAELENDEDCLDALTTPELEEFVNELEEEASR